MQSQNKPRPQALVNASACGEGLLGSESGTRKAITLDIRTELRR